MKYFLVLAALALAASADSEYVTSHVSLYYESLCPYSEAFITGSLNDAYTNVPELISNLTLVPYGNAREHQDTNGSYYYTCQHGANECVGNQKECCLIDIYQDYNIHFPIINCMEGAKQPWNALDECGAAAGYDMTPVDECYTDLMGTKLEHYAGQQQAKLNPPLTYVPWIVIDGVHDTAIQDQAQSDLTRYLCDKQTTNCPPGCYKLSPAPGCHNIGRSLAE
eukprot:CAMPEP_0201522684 /NCGR_PEP_ID=MMETSP0161_2-20130828/18482_1 /ASSEMBLY_ACC=CAM_ASM_000251 /TAXON_ID=180227 /ORGANISM="Neoparamoeba aestuarina, Strain SoJaBio B1-5/56/2" /LENGTH=222 /DNA_ID=CAMNT_0047921599 /DNA_START=59 /DNA_END=727 /DNA_ORIENTATION=-